MNCALMLNVVLECEVFFSQQQTVQWELAPLSLTRTLYETPSISPPLWNLWRETKRAQEIV